MIICIMNFQKGGSVCHIFQMYFKPHHDRASHGVSSYALGNVNLVTEFRYRSKSRGF